MAAGDLLGHIRYTGADRNDPSVRLYRTRERLSFHSDGADIICLLFQPFPFDRNDEQDPGELPYFRMPLSGVNDGRFSMFNIGWYIRDSQRLPETPRLTAEQTELIDLIDEIAEDPANHIEMTFERGDLQLAENAALLHSRHEFVDHDDPARRRDLLRLWLSARNLDDGTDALRGGIPAREGHDSDTLR